MEALTKDYSRIESALLFLEKNHPSRPGLKEIAQSVNLSEYHFQRLFRRWAGISPKRFLQYLTLRSAKGLFNGSRSLLDVAYETGLSSPSRLHDLFVSAEAVTPGEYKARGQGLKITYGFHPTPFGECLVAVTERGICFLAFTPAGGRERSLRQLKGQWTGAELEEDAAATRPYASRIFSPRPVPGARQVGGRRGRPLTLFLKGTNFQLKVWEALLRTSPGSVLSYKQLAERVGRRGGARAVGQAVARNPVAFLIPCHRVIQKTGVIGNYRWGPARKKAMLAWEAARKDVSPIVPGGSSGGVNRADSR